MESFKITTPTLKQDFISIARIHQKSINLGFLSQLGLGFLYYLYLSMINSSSNELLIAKNNDKVIGFISGGTTLKPVLIHMIKYYFFQVVWNLTPHLFSFSNIRKIIDLSKYSNPIHTTDSLPKAELLSLAVNDDYRGQGVAKELYLELVKNFRAKGHKEFKIIVGDELKEAQNFYKKMGAKYSGEIELHANSLSKLYIATI